MNNGRRLNVFSLRVLHKGCATLEHAIAEQNTQRWEPYVPTHFIYSFVAFNTLYNVDWDKSVDIKKIWIHKSTKYNRITEHDKIDAYISFCCQDEDFLQEYKEFFIGYITAHYNTNDLLKQLKQIREDKQPNGSIWDKEYIDNFHNTCKECFVNNVFNEEVVRVFVDFIYSVRCNLFHGVKGMNELNDQSQQVRFDIYSLLIIAINQMIFSYLDYRDGKDITSGFETLIKDLKWNKLNIL